MSYQYYRDIVDYVFTKPEEAEKIYSSPPDQKEFNQNNRIFKPYFNEEILKLESPQETTLRDYIRVRLGMVSFPDTTEADKIKKRKRLYGIFIAAVYHIWKNSMQSIDTVELESTNGGGFFFNKTRKKGKKKNKKKKKTFKRKKKERKWTDTSYPYRDVTKGEAIKDFLTLRKLVQQKDWNAKSIAGNALIDWGTEKARRKTKYRNKSFIDKWNNKTRRKKMLEFAKRLHKKTPGKSVLGSIRSAIDLQWGTVNTLRAAAAACMYKKYKAKRVLDFTAGWGARMVAAMALDIDYIGIDSNTSLRPGYNKIIKLLKPYTKSKVKMYFKKAEKVDFSKIGKYDYVFTSPPYEYLEAYENMKNYEGDGKIKQPSSSQKIKMDDSAKFYDEFLVPTLKKAYKYLPKNKHICLNMPDIMYDKIKKRWIPVTRKETYNIVKRTGGPHGKENRRGKELIFCWKK